KPIIIFSVVTNALINFIITLTVVLVFAIFNGVTFGWNVVFVPLLLIEIVLLATGLAFILSTLFVKFRDLAPIWEVVMQAGLYATPIIYPVTLVSDSHRQVAEWMLMNPMAQIIQDLRYILTFSNNANPTVWQLVHNPFMVAVPYVLPVLIFFFGFWIFNKNANKFAEIV
ncbi:MAG: ABC transporter permease, partial [Streptococcaceae bacterium]|nr:ABC transporter permease [Streptococcaceae bacterium]